jgi:flagellar biosynthesis/type III secretory pathway protein FliH
MAHLKMLETKKDAQRRKEVKLWLIRRLFELGYSRPDVVHLFQFIDWLIMLPRGLKQQFWAELKTYEEERRMPYITSVEKIGFERGHQQGRQEGRQEEGRSLVLRQLTRRVGVLPEEVRSQVESLSLEQLEALAEALLDFTGLQDLQGWLIESGKES